MRILGIDFGDARIGLAISDPMGWTAQGLETLEHKGEIDKAVLKVLEVINSYKVEKVVVGFPKNMNGTIGPRGEKTQEFIDSLLKSVDIPVIKWDERLTSVAAHRTMQEIGKKTKGNKGMVDRLAATYILQGFLDSL